MDNRASTGQRQDTLDAYRAETIIYRGYPVRRGFALLLEGELTDRSYDALVGVGALPAVTDEVPFPDSQARTIITGEDIDVRRDQFHFDLEP